MPDSGTEHSSTTNSASAGKAEGTDSNAVMKLEKRNIISLVIHQVLFRTAWIFKTESVIIPAFLDSISDAGWVRGMLPPLNRFGQSIAPLLLSDRLSRATYKSRWLAKSTFFLSLPFLSLGLMLLLFGDKRPSWFVFFFLTSYATFFCVHGVNQASFNTIQGKLIRPEHRGRLITIAGGVGGATVLALYFAPSAYIMLMSPKTEFAVDSIAESDRISDPATA